MTLAKSSVFGIKKILLLGTGSSLIIILSVLLTIQKNSDRFLTALENFIRPQTTDFKTTDSTLLLKQIQSLQELTTTTYQIETIVPTHADRILGKDWTIATTKLLYLATGEVSAGIDLSELTSEDVKIEPERITIALPPAQILDRKIDIDNSRVYHYDRGFLNLGPDVAPQLQTLAQKTTLDKIVTAACERNILTTANRKAEKAISNLVAITNERSIEIEFISSQTSQCEL